MHYHQRSSMKYILIRLAALAARESNVDKSNFVMIANGVLAATIFTLAI